MKKIIYLLFLLPLFSLNINGQHCAPIEKTLLSEISVVRTEKSLNFQFEFIKNGGKIKKAYQIYFIGYLDKNKERVFEEKNNEKNRQKQIVNLSDKAVCVILNKDIIKLADRYDKVDQASIYSYSISISYDMLAEKVIEYADFKNENEYLGEFKIAVFIPFLDSKEYSTDSRLPKDTHECNYSGRSSLIFNELPYIFKVYSRDKYEKTLGAYYIAPRLIYKGDQ